MLGSRSLSYYEEVAPPLSIWVIRTSCKILFEECPHSCIKAQKTHIYSTPFVSDEKKQRSLEKAYYFHSGGILVANSRVDFIVFIPHSIVFSFSNNVYQRSDLFEVRGSESQNIRLWRNLYFVQILSPNYLICAYIHCWQNKEDTQNKLRWGRKGKNGKKDCDVNNF